MKAFIKGEARISIDTGEDEYDSLASYEVEWLLPKINKKNPDDEFVQYAGDLPFVSKLKEGFTHFELVNNVFYSVCVYELNEPLTEQELKELAEYTQGQWSDGIGECFEQFPCITLDGWDVYISMWIPDQQLTYYQI